MALQGFPDGGLFDGGLRGLRGQISDVSPVLGLPIKTPAIGGATTAPTVAASFAWSASASSPLVGVNTPAVSASLVWSASAADPLVGVNAPAVAAGFVWSVGALDPLVGVTAPSVSTSLVWSASAADPSIGSGATDVTASTAQASFTWSAAAADPTFDTLAPAVAGNLVWSAAALDARIDITAAGVAASVAWQAAAGDPFETAASDVTTPDVAAVTAWLAISVDAVPTTAGRNEADDWNLAGYDVRARRVQAKTQWRATVSMPRIGAPRIATTAPACRAGLSWSARAHAPLINGLRRTASMSTLQRSTTGRAQLIRSTAATLQRGR